MSNRDSEEILDALAQLGEDNHAAFNPDTKIPQINTVPAQKEGEIPLYGFYGDSFFSARPSAELMDKERKRFYQRQSEDDDISILEEGLCAKYGIVPPKKKPNRRGDRGEGGDEILILGETVNDRRNPKLWGIRQEDRTRHAYCIGGSGSGKSTLLHALGVEDMWYWRGGLLMEPHGDLARGLLRCAPPYRIHDIIYLNVLDTAASPGFNPLELPIGATDEARAEAVGKVTTLISKHFNMESGMVRLQKMLENALVALSYVPGATLLEIMDFYTNEDLRASVLSWMPEGSPQKDSIESIAMGAKADDLASLENRLARFSTNRYLRHMFGQSHTTVDFYSLMNQGAYIICPISKGGTTDDTFLKFYGSYVVSEVYKSAVMREAIEEDDRVNFALTLDEFQNFLTGDIEGILAEARKYGLCLMLANQYLAQLDNETKAAVLQNCATKLCYNLGPLDAPEMARTYAHGITAADMMSIPKYHVMAAPLVRGENVQPFISSVFAPIKLKSECSGITADIITEISRNRYMKSREAIDFEIQDRKERLISGNRQAMLDLVTKKNT